MDEFVMQAESNGGSVLVSMPSGSRPHLPFEDRVAKHQRVHRLQALVTSVVVGSSGNGADTGLTPTGATAVSRLDFDRAKLRTPKSAAYAGIVFSTLVFASLLTVDFAVPHKPADSEGLLTTSPRRDLLLIGLSLIPFAAVAFLWFVGVIRDLIGDREDKFFATVFLGSGLLFVGMLLVGEAMVSGMVLSVQPGAQTLSATPPDWWTTTRHISHEMLEAALQMAGAFTTATATLLFRTGTAPRWLTLSGTIVAVLLFFATFFTQWIGLLFPVWVFVVSVYILVATRREDVLEAL